MKPTIILLIAIVLSSAISCGTISHEKFDSEKWKHSNDTSEATWSLRWDMMNDLRNNYALVGKTRKQIIDLLGKPDGNDDTKMSYYLGYSKTGINTGTLTLIFDKDDKVTKISVWQG
jgi:outer membrane protein assembly factor BamE (lipoprotein component of BamABCDE complex)